MVTESTPSSKQQACAHFAELAAAFLLLQEHGRAWTEDDIVSVFDELTGQSVRRYSRARAGKTTPEISRAREPSADAEP